MSKLNQELAKVVKEFRIKKGMTQLELSEKLGYETPQFISIMERGLAKIPLNVIGQLVVILEVPEKKITRLLIEAYKEEVLAQLHQGKTLAKNG